MGVGRGTRQVFLGNRQSELGFLDWPLPSQPRGSANRPARVGAARRAAPRFRRKAPSLRDEGGCAAKVGRLGDPSLPRIFRQALTHRRSPASPPLFGFYSNPDFPECCSMNAGRKSLPHDLPLWLDIHGVVFFMTCCVKDRRLMPFA